MSDTSQLSAGDVADRVRDLFAAVRDALPDEAATNDESTPVDALSESERADLRSLGTEAADLLERSEPASLLAALDIDRADDPGSIPAAILAGDPDDVAELRALVTVSRLAPDDEDADASFGEDERDAVATLADHLPVESSDETATAAAGTDAGADETPDDAPSDSDAGDEAGEDEVTAALQDALDEVRMGLDDVLGVGGQESDDETSGDGESADDGLAAAAGDLVDEADTFLGDAGDGESADGGDEATDEGGGSAEDGSDDGDGGDEDGGLLGIGDGGLLDDDRSIGGGESDRTRQSTSGSGRTSYSTMPEQDRPDMTGPARYRTMPDR